MSLAQIGLGIVGAIAGYFTGGAGWYLVGAMLMGASLGVAAGSFIDPQRPDVAAPGSAQSQVLDMPTIEEGTLVYDILGTSKTVGQIFWHGLNRNEPIIEEVETGGKGGDSDTEKVIRGYKYYLSWCQGLCIGPAESLLTVYNGDDIVWEGDAKYTDRNASGYTAVTLANLGEMRFYFGGTDHAKITPIGTVVGATYNPPYRNYCFAYFNDVFIGQFNRAPIIRFVVKKRPVFAFNSNANIGIYDYNAAHCLYYIIVKLVGFPTTWINEQSFSDFADIMVGIREQHGLSMLFSRQENALTYLNSVLTHVGAVMRYGIDGKFHLKELRDYEDKADLPSINQDQFTKPMTFNRKAWTESLNEVAVQYAPRFDILGFLPGNSDVYAFSFIDEAHNYDDTNPEGQGYCQGNYNPGDPGAPNGLWATDYAAAQVTKTWLKSGSVWTGACMVMQESNLSYSPYIIPNTVTWTNVWDNAQVRNGKIIYTNPAVTDANGMQATFLDMIPDHGYRDGSWFIFSWDDSPSMDATQKQNAQDMIDEFTDWLGNNGYSANVYTHDESENDERWLDWLLTNFDY